MGSTPKSYVLKIHHKPSVWDTPIVGNPYALYVNPYSSISHCYELAINPIKIIAITVFPVVSPWFSHDFDATRHSPLATAINGPPRCKNKWSPKAWRMGHENLPSNLTLNTVINIYIYMLYIYIFKYIYFFFFKKKLYILNIYFICWNIINVTHYISFVYILCYI